MQADDYLTAPDAHMDPFVASVYDEAHRASFAADKVDAAVAVLAELAGSGTAVEFAIGTGRIGIPLSAAGVEVCGIDSSGPMLDALRAKPGSEKIRVVVGDMTTEQLCTDASLVYLVFNTIMNLRAQELQVACFRNMANHLAVGGYALIETVVPQLRRVPVGETIRPFDVSTGHLGFEEYVDFVNQISISHHYFIDGDKVRVNSPAFRYVWPSELDLMAQIAGMKLVDRWADWDRSVFTGGSRSHVSVWQKQETAGRLGG